MNNDLHKRLDAEINKSKIATATKVYLLYCCTYTTCDHIGIFSTYSKANKIKTKLLTERNITANIEEYTLDSYSFKGL